MPERLSQDIAQSSSVNAGYVQMRRERTISIPSPDSDREMAIRCADWKMLETRLTAALNPPKDYSALYGTLFGLSGSAGLSLIPLSITKDLPAWVLPAYGAIAVACLFCGIFTVFLSRDQRKTRKTMMTILLDDVREIGSRFAPGPTQGEQNIGAIVVEVSNRAGS
jgi:hypothetical protein